MNDNSKDIEKLEDQINGLAEMSETDNKVDNHVVYIDSLTDNHIQKELEDDTLKVNNIDELKTEEVSEVDSDTKRIDKIDEVFEDNSVSEPKEVTVQEQDNPEEEPVIIKEKISYTKYYVIIAILAIILAVLLYFLFK